ncbi:hypothetical protein VYU27_009323, partial [Nannochloropsis oceanica]
ITDFGLSALYSGGSTGGAGSREGGREGAGMEGNGAISISVSRGGGGGGGGGGGMSSASLLHTTCGSPNYVAPEVLADRGYDGRMADVWSCGVILFVLITGYLPFEEKKISELFLKISLGAYVCPEWVSEEARGLIRKILVPDPRKRIGIKDIWRDEWMMKGEEGGGEGQTDGRMMLGRNETTDGKEDKEGEDGKWLQHQQHDEREVEEDGLEEAQREGAVTGVISAEGGGEGLNCRPEGKGEGPGDEDEAGMGASPISDEEESCEGGFQRQRQPQRHDSTMCRLEGREGKRKEGNEKGRGREEGAEINREGGRTDCMKDIDKTLELEECKIPVEK